MSVQLDYTSNEVNNFLEQLKAAIIVDIGSIIETTPDGKAIVELYDGRKLSGVELAYAGGVGDGLNDCLVFIPRICYNSDSGADLRQPPFSRAGVKAVPISLGKTSRASVGNTDDGSFSVAKESLMMALSAYAFQLKTNSTRFSLLPDNNITFVWGDGLVVFSMTDEKTRLVMYSADYTPYYMKVISGAVISEYFAGTTAATDEEKADMDSYASWTRSRTYNADGTITETIGEDTPITFTYTNNKVNVVITGEDNSIMISTENATVNIDTDGNISITNKGTLTVESEGDASITTKGALSVSSDGDASVSVGGKADISVTGDASITAGASMTLETANGTLGDLIKEICQDISSLTTVGSPAAHTVNPSSQAVFTQLSTLWTQFFK